jgi:spore germination cell wall hydrolase CwlJ-like protein
MKHVVLNRVDHKKYPDTICGVVYEAKRYSWNNDVVIPGQCQFSWYCDGIKDDPQLFYKSNGSTIEPNMRDWRISVQVAIKMVEKDIWYRDPTRGATHYYNHNLSTPSWSRVYPVSIVVGNHTFLIRND